MRKNETLVKFVIIIVFGFGSPGIITIFTIGKGKSMEKHPGKLKDFLDEQVEFYNRPSFISDDPISIPHRFNRKEDIEIAGFLAATIAWGNRKIILRNANRIIELLDNSPYEFIKGAEKVDYMRMKGFVHRTFNSDDLVYFLKALQYIYNEEGGLEAIFSVYQSKESLQPAIHEFRRIFFKLPHDKGIDRHVSDPEKGSAAKKINMFLRWMIRKDNKGVDFGIWKSISPSILSCPLDVHSGNIARELGILKRKQNDSKAVAELDNALRSFDPADPVKYDFALFGLGAVGKYQYTRFV